MSPTKIRSPVKVPTTEKLVFVSQERELNSERGFKQTILFDPRPSSSKKKAIMDLPLEIVKVKLNKYKTRLNKIQQGLDTIDTIEAKRKTMVSPRKTVVFTKDICQSRSLIKFYAFELEIVR